MSFYFRNRIIKENPYHDEDGKFTTAEKDTSGAGRGVGLKIPEFKVQKLDEALLKKLNDAPLTVESSRSVESLKSTQPKGSLGSTSPTTTIGLFSNAIKAYTGSFASKVSNASYDWIKKGELDTEPVGYEKSTEVPAYMLAQTVVRGILESNPIEEPIYRGISAASVPGSPGERRVLGPPIPSLDELKVGSKMDIPGVKSFSASREVADSFMSVGDNRYLIEVTGPKQALKLASFSVYPEQQEVITFGRFKVVAVKTETKTYRTNPKYGAAPRDVQYRLRTITVQQEKG